MGFFAAYVVIKKVLDLVYREALCNLLRFRWIPAVIIDLLVSL